MKNILPFLAGMLLFAACSTPKYAYYFDHYDYNSGKKAALAEKTIPDNNVEAATNSQLTDESLLVIQKETLTASAEMNVVAAPEKVAPKPSSNPLTITKKYKEMTKSEKKEFRKALMTEIKNYKKIKKSGKGDIAHDTKVMDHDLKLAIIFGAIALTLSFFGGVNSVFWVISVISLVVGVVFFVKWITEQ